ncbi:MAG: hypothetical protein HYS88_00740 [Candidatus Colwellbacteria bacterium]|nr:hypothetical protein [Candidatus Colwellbacteria bacterium]
MSRFKRYQKHLRDLFREPHVKIGILVFLITFLGFGIGYLIGRDWTPAPIVIEKIENRR